MNCATCSLPIPDLEAAINDFEPGRFLKDGRVDELFVPSKVYYHEGCQPISGILAMPRLMPARTPQNPGTIQASASRAVMGLARTPERAGLPPGQVGQMSAARTPWNKDAKG